MSPWCGVRSSFVRTADFVGLYTATGGAEFGPPPLGGPCVPPLEDTVTCPSAGAADTALELDLGALCFHCRGVRMLNLGAL